MEEYQWWWVEKSVGLSDRATWMMKVCGASDDEREKVKKRKKEEQKRKREKEGEAIGVCVLRGNWRK